MKRAEFLKKGLIAGAAVAAAPVILKTSKVEAKNSTYNKLMQQVGFNHLPNEERKTMNSVIHKASSRGHADHGWLNSHHSFSFANYYNPERMNFGVLRVLNDDSVCRRQRIRNPPSRQYGNRLNSIVGRPGTQGFHGNGLSD